MFFFKRRKRISDLVDGETATIEGVVVSENNIKEQFSGKQCVYSAVLQEVYKVGPRGKGRPLWYCENYNVKCNGILLSDGNDQILLNERDTSHIIVKGAHQDIGSIGQKRTRRYVASFIQKGDKLKAKGVVHRLQSNNPNNVATLSAPPGKDLKLSVKSK